MSEIRYQSWFIGEVEEGDVLEVANMVKVWWVDITMLSTLHFTEPVWILKHAATVTVKSLREIEEGVQKEIIQRKKMAIIPL